MAVRPIAHFFYLLPDWLFWLWPLFLPAPTTLWPLALVLGIVVLIGATLVLANKRIAGGALIILAILPIGVYALVGFWDMMNLIGPTLVGSLGGALAIYDGIAAYPDVE